VVIVCDGVLSGGMLEYCTYNRDVYSVGESWLVDDCTQCTCVEAGQVMCTVNSCEITSLDHS